MTTPVAEQAVAIVSDYFRTPINSLEASADALSRELARARTSGRMTAAVLDELVEPHAQLTLDLAGTSVYGAGFIAAVDLLSDARSHLAWWQGPERHRLVLAAQSVNKERIDYNELEWFRIPMATGAPHVAGPYVDYLCSDEYMMTVASPVQLDGEFVGVAGLDLLIDSVERQLVPLLEALERVGCDGIALEVIAEERARG
ncbi:MAG: cache domain-containing protein [Gemmatimonadota bacterium]